MSKKVFNPNPLSAHYIFLFIVVIIFTSFISFFIWNTYNVNQQFSADHLGISPDSSITMLGYVAPIFLGVLMVVFLAWVVIASRTRYLSINNNNLDYTNTLFIEKNKSKIIPISSIQDLSIVTKEAPFPFTYKTLIGGFIPVSPIIPNLDRILLITVTSNTKIEIPLTWWDNTTLKHFFTEVKQKYPQIKTSESLTKI